MNPLFFGTSRSPLFGVYHPPKGSSQRSSGVVLCYPFGQEYMRAHRAFRQLAMLLTKAGFHVFRFDYYGTGDSAGDSTLGTVGRWVEDVGTAIDELKETAEVGAISVVGLRLGAAIGLMGSAGRTDVEKIVLWDPIVDGAEYVLALETEGVLRESHRSEPAVLEAGLLGVLGFPLTNAMRTGMEGIKLADVAVRPEIGLHVVVSEDTDQYRNFQRSISSTRPGDTYSHVHSPGNWNEVDDNGSALIPQAVIRDIVEHVERST